MLTIYSAASQSFCNSATVSNLTATGSSVQWYAASTGGGALAGSTVLTNGTTYYASQTISGCESSSRLAVTASINAPSAPTGAASQTFCNSATISDLTATGSSIQWYAAPTGGGALAGSTVLTNGTTYYASQTISGCESSSRLAVVVTLNVVTDLTTNVSGITITANNTSASYVWLNCDNNFSIIPGQTAQSFVPNVNGAYAVQLTQNGCVDTSACVSINAVGLVENSFKNDFIIYPNPTRDFATIDLEDDNYSIMVFDQTGKLVFKQNATSGKIQMDINTLNSGIYVVRIEGEKGVFNGAIVKE